MSEPYSNTFCQLPLPSAEATPFTTHHDTPIPLHREVRQSDQRDAPLVGSTGDRNIARNVGGSRSAHPAAPAPVAAPPSPPPMTGGGGGGFMSNMVGNVAGGMASGVGFGVAQRAVDAVMGPRSVEVVHTNNAPLPAPQTPTMQQGLQRDPCSAYQEELNQCMTRHTDIALCQNYLDNLKACQMQMNNGA
ncbi:chch domain-containing protein [Cyclospora cayetanensis]|uniref:Chch domain-containing protein n=1 Tax=Cyclospora cayetanensis TaxID=88456 RepID=A0A1D3CYV6_9EIME|nr:chch domain-containing protein [Cyclospora cayetanensis]